MDTNRPTERRWWSMERVRDRLRLVALFLVLLWGIQLIGLVALSWLGQWQMPLAVVPRSLRGLPGIVTMHFAHDGFWTHLLPNTVPLAILLGLLAVTRRNFMAVAAAIGMLGAALLWIVGRQQAHIGASVLIYGLITFHIGTGWFERKPRSLLIAAVVGLLYWWTFFWGVLPFQQSERVSWDGHLCGAIAGLIVAMVVEWRERDRDGAKRLPNLDPKRQI